jgi:chitinase
VKQSFLHAFLCLFLGFSTTLHAQMPSPALVGYWHNWNTASAPGMALTAVDTRYNVINVSFGVPINGTDYQIGFTPFNASQATFIAQINTVKSGGRKVILSLGGGNDPVRLDNITERDVFISSVNGLLSTYPFDGIDIDFEGSSLSVSGGTIANPIDAHILHLIFAIKSIMATYRSTHGGQKMLLTMAPETAFVPGGQSAYNGVWGAYLPIVHGLRDSLDKLMVQLYNSGSMYGINGGVYTQGSADFLVALTEATIQGFHVDRWNNQAGPFIGLPASKIAIGLPACPSAAGGGFTDTATIGAAVRYLRGVGPKPGAYTLVQVGGYPSLGGLMTWSVNWDASTFCNAGPNYFAQTYQRLFSTPLPAEITQFDAQVIDNEDIKLVWKVVQATDITAYAVEHSIDAVTWETIQLVPSIGDHSDQHTYATKHLSPNKGRHYYRLRMVELAANHERYSQMAVAVISAEKSLTCTIYPNPTADIVHFCTTEGIVRIQIVNALGTTFQPIEIPSSPEISLAGFAQGLYLVVFEDAQGNREVQRVTKI